MRGGFKLTRTRELNIMKTKSMNENEESKTKDNKRKNNEHNFR